MLGRRLGCEPLERRLVLAAPLADFPQAVFSPPAAALIDAAPRVVSSSILEGDRLTPGSRIYQARFDAPLAAAAVDAADVVLTGAALGTRAADAVSYDPALLTLTALFDDLREDTYTLRLVSGDGHLEGTAGEDLDGEAHPITTVPSGDGQAGGDFAVHFFVLLDREPLPVPLAAEAPPGSLIYTTTKIATIDAPGRRVHFSIDLDAGQTAAVVVQPGSTLRPTITLADPAGNDLGQAVAPAAGASALVPAADAASPGRYTVSVGGASGTTGGFSVRLVVNAAVEAESHALGSNDTAALSEDLDASRIALGPAGVERGAVVGTLAAGDADWYRFSLQDSQAVTAVLTSTGAQLELFDAQVRPLAAGAPEGDEQQVVRGLRDTTADAQADPYYVRVAGAAGEYRLVLTVGADFARIAGDDDEGPGAPAQDISLTGTVLGAASSPTTFAVIGDYGDFSFNATQVARMVDLWEPEFVITTGDNLYGDASLGHPDWSRGVGDLYGEYILGRSDNRYSEQTSPTQRFFPSIGNHDVIGGNAAGYLDYFHDDPAGGRLPEGVHENFNTYYDFQWGPIHFFAIDSEHAMSSAASLAAQMQWLQTSLAQSQAPWKLVYFHDPPLSSSGPVPVMDWPYAAWGADAVLTGHRHNYERLVRDGLTYLVVGASGAVLHLFTSPMPGSLVRYDSDFGAMRVTVSADTATLEFLSLDDGGRGALGGRPIDTFSLVKPGGGGGGESGAEGFALSVRAADRLLLETFTPGSAAGQPVNALDPAIELLNPQGQAVAFSDVGGPGNNARLEHTAAKSGTYTVRVPGMGGSVGEYVLRARGHTGDLPPFAATVRGIDNQVTLTETPSRVTVEFDDQVRLDTVHATDLLVDGFPALDTAVVDGRTIAFVMQPLADGPHRIEISAGSMADLQGTPLAGLSRVFTIDSTPPAVTAVLVGGGSFSGALLEVAGSRQPGTSGVRIPDGAGQLAGLPWIGIDRLQVTFGEDVVLSAGDLTLSGVNVDRYEIAGFSYDGQTRTATWTLDRTVLADKLLLRLSDQVRDAAGNPLDGDWVDGVSRFPSGDGRRDNGGFLFRINTLPGDVDGSGRVDRVDFARLVTGLGSGAHDAPYNARADLNADGMINTRDLRELLYRHPNALPVAEPAPLDARHAAAATDPLFDEPRPDEAGAWRSPSTRRAAVPGHADRSDADGGSLGLPVAGARRTNRQFHREKATDGGAALIHGPAVKESDVEIRMSKELRRTKLEILISSF